MKELRNPYDFDPDGDLVLVLTDQATPVGSPKQGSARMRRRSVRMVDIRCRVSSKHLSLVSPVFRAILQRQFKEATTLRSTGTAAIPLADDCLPAFIILLNIIHGHTRAVPRELSLDMLTEVAILVDKYDCLEVVEVYSDRWIDKFKEEEMQYVPGGLTKSLMQWLCIAWVFRKHEEFTMATMAATRSAAVGDLADGLPIPSSVLGQFYRKDSDVRPKLMLLTDTIETTRQQALSRVISKLQSVLETYQGNSPRCRRSDGRAPDCDAMAFGGLIKGFRPIGIYPWPVPPYKDLGFNSLEAEIRSIRLPTLCKIYSSGYGSSPSCEPDVKSSTKGLGLSGLNLDDFLGRGEETGEPAE
ncbi:MAG: hypothetical protein M1839_004509 [Geoglossum umbratile]|nr:MAG: hypothetical protein M1839_004509 [Geoglossum umbratile]